MLRNPSSPCGTIFCWRSDFLCTLYGLLFYNPRRPPGPEGSDWTHPYSLLAYPLQSPWGYLYSCNSDGCWPTSTPGPHQTPRALFELLVSCSRRAALIELLMTKAGCRSAFRCLVCPWQASATTPSMATSTPSVKPWRTLPTQSVASLRTRPK